jgi:hypothetical protein
MNNQFLRHLIATINYRFQKSIQNSSDNFGAFNLGKGSRSPVEIVNHMYQVLRSTRIFIKDEKLDHQSAPQLSWTGEINRFKVELAEVDKLLVHQEVNLAYTKKLIQGPLSDILTHVGQISMLQRLDDRPIAREDFSAASIKTGMDGD